jgi:hypothetical protein
MPSKGKAKGNNYEREIARHLGQVFNLNFERVPNSGAFTGGKNSFRLDRLTEAQQLLTRGDIIVPEELSNIAIECKNYKDFAWASLFSEVKQLDGWIEQAQCNTDYWFLVFKINRCGSKVVFDIQHFDLFQKPGNYMIYKGTIITQLEDFFELNKDLLLQLNN